MLAAVFTADSRQQTAEGTGISCGTTFTTDCTSITTRNKKSSARASPASRRRRLGSIDRAERTSSTMQESDPIPSYPVPSCPIPAVVSTKKHPTPDHDLLSSPASHRICPPPITQHHGDLARRPEPAASLLHPALDRSAARTSLQRVRVHARTTCLQFLLLAHTQAQLRKPGARYPL